MALIASAGFYGCHRSGELVRAEPLTSHSAENSLSDPCTSTTALACRTSFPITRLTTSSATDATRPRPSSSCARAGGATFYASLGLSKAVIMALGRWMSSSWTIYIRDNPAVPFQGARPKRMRASGSGESQSRLTTFPLPLPPPAAVGPHRWKSRTRRSQCRTRTRASGVARPSATRVSPQGLVRRPRASLTTGSAPSSVATQAALVQRQGDLRETHHEAPVAPGIFDEAS
jgi:hypothetical protein